MNLFCNSCGHSLDVSGVPMAGSVRCPICRSRIPLGGDPEESTEYSIDAREDVVEAKSAPVAPVRPRSGLRAGMLGLQSLVTLAGILLLTILAAYAGRRARATFANAASPAGQEEIALTQAAKLPYRRVTLDDNPRAAAGLTPWELVRLAAMPDLSAFRRAEREDRERLEAQAIAKQRNTEIRHFAAERLAKTVKDTEEQTRILAEQEAKRKEAESKERKKMLEERLARFHEEKRLLEKQVYDLEDQYGQVAQRYQANYWDAAQTRARAYEWQRQLFFDVSTQSDTLTHYNAPVFLWSAPELEVRYAREWRRFSTLSARAIGYNTQAALLQNNWAAKKLKLAELDKAIKDAETELNQLVPAQK